MRNNSRIILLDVGGTFIKSALGIPEAGAVEGTFQCTPISSDGTAEQIQEAFRQAVVGQMKAAAEYGCQIEAICSVIPGPFDYTEGRFLMKHKFVAVYGRTFREILGDVIGEDIRLAFAHDVNGALHGALETDHSLKCGTVALSTLGTGLGFAYAIDGQVQASPTGSPAVSIWNAPYMDGILEDYVSRRAILRFYAELGGKLDEGDDVKEIADRAREGDENALETFRLIGRHYASGVGHVISSLNITRLLFAGQISKSFDLMEKEIINGLGEGVQVNVLDDIQGTVLKGLVSM